MAIYNKQKTMKWNEDSKLRVTVGLCEMDGVGKYLGDDRPVMTFELRPECWEGGQWPC